MILADSWSAGTLIGVPLILLLIVIGAAIAYFGRRDVYDGDAFVVGGVAVIACALIGAAWGFFPYSAQYHKWHDTTGTVAAVSSRFLGNSKSTTQRFVVRFANGDERACDDTRCALVKVGDALSLTCKRHWQFAGQDGWDCNFVDDRHARPTRIARPKTSGTA